jgi:hypothetical protein
MKPGLHLLTAVSIPGLMLLYLPLRIPSRLAQLAAKPSRYTSKKYIIHSLTK